MRTGKAESDVNVPSMSTACADCGKIHRAAAQNGKILDIDCIVFKGLEDCIAKAANRHLATFDFNIMQIIQFQIYVKY